MKLMSPYNPHRIYAIFTFVMTVFLIIMKRKQFLGFKPLSPDRFKETIDQLGVCFIKFAQVLATRADFFPPEYLQKLKQLHDEVEPMSERDLERVFSQAFGNKNPFSHFEQTPIASATIGQVHVAYLKDPKTRVAVKLRRFGIKKRVVADIKILTLLNKFFKPMFSSYTNNSIETLIMEFSEMILLEIDLRNELENIREFSTIYAKEDIVFPKTYATFSSESVLVMSFEEGIRLSDMVQKTQSTVNKIQFNFNHIMEQLIRFYIVQILAKGVFHADPHPGNMLINSYGKLVMLDFGMVKRIPNETRFAIIEMVKAAYEYEFERFIAACTKLGIIAYEAPKAQIQEYAKRVFDIFGDDHLSASTMQDLAFELLGSMQAFPFKLPQDVVYVIRAGVMIEGLGTARVENFNSVKDIFPLLKVYIPQALLLEEQLIQSLFKEVQNFPLILRRVRDIFYHLNDGSMSMKVARDQMDWVEKEVRGYMKHLVAGFILMLFGIAFLHTFFPGHLVLGWFVLILGALKMVYSL
ncbi:MAG: ABC transporter [Candidatus Magnetoglobus multicellularis str. Araruama]|uniref:ABC transporter n=1 Tax=Candidatus Magnetoglobus multicellularis str. Araruama TaxID=890399 RepID=A0A1V1PFY8_9BACT|nr:MAG: ABC transporter [Candidatus Magnetoglobus multicellularis str. Araruama]